MLVHTGDTAWSGPAGRPGTASASQAAEPAQKPQPRSVADSQCQCRTDSDPAAEPTRRSTVTVQHSHITACRITSRTPWGNCRYPEAARAC
eukprot:2369892-Rhodomonas_salina.3